MNKILISIISLLFFFQSAAVLWGGDSKEGPPPLLFNQNLETVITDLNSKVPELMQEGRIPGLQIALIREGQVVWEKGFGIKRQGSRSPVNGNTVFEAASLTKPLFAYTVMRLVDQGIIDLDQPLAGCFTREEIEKGLGHSLEAEGFKREWFEKITARHILSHTAGTPHGEREKVFPLFFEPGTQWKYSAEGYGLLQQVVEKKTGESLDDVIKKLVFEPLGMKKSHMVWQPVLEKTMANGHNIFSQPQDFRKRSRPTAAASLTTTAGDYARFVCAVLNGQGLKPETSKIMLTRVISFEENENLGWSLGFGLQNDPNGKAIWQWGDYGIFRNYVIAYPEKKTGMVYLTNSFNGLSICSELIKGSVGGSALGNEELGYSSHDSLFYTLLWKVEREGAESADGFLTELKKNSRGPLPWKDIRRAGLIFKEEGMPDKAQAIFEFIYRENPSSGRACYELAQNCLLRGEFQKARSLYQQALQASEDRVDAKAINWDMDYLQAAEKPCSLDEKYMEKLSGDYETRHIIYKNGQLTYFREGGSTAEPRLVLAFSRDTFFIEGVVFFRFQVEFDPQGNPLKIIGFYNTGQKDQSLRTR